MHLRLTASVDPRTQILLNVADSVEISKFFNHGPFDGDCLIAAKAILEVWGGNLVRVDWDPNPDEAREIYTLHYGAEVDGKFFDFAGVFNSSKAWINNLRKMEAPALSKAVLVVRSGMQPDWDDSGDQLPNDPEAIAGVADLIRKAQQGS